MSEAGRITVGRIRAAHGVGGEVQVEPLTDFPERFRRRRRYWLEGREDGWREVERVRRQGAYFLVKFRGVEDREAAEALRGAELQVPAEELEPLPAGVYYDHQLLGLEVRDRDGRLLGRVEGVEHPPANDVLRVRKSGGEGRLWIPALRDVVLAILPEEGRIVVDLPPGTPGLDERR
ncbi:MAG: 16S rRNA processing protein RimM [Clostridia bacterium]|nr:16S rRNA processing protein RimM [Clostridia bacterium]MCL6521637.1 ribosome maturation factor RimM [Bacillota bacterium]